MLEIIADNLSNDLSILHAQRSLITEILRRKENFACVRIFYFASTRKTGDIDVTTVLRERTGNYAWFTGHSSSIRQLSFLLVRDRGCLCHADLALTRRRRDWAAQSLTIRSIARRSLILLMGVPMVALPGVNCFPRRRPHDSIDRARVIPGTRKSALQLGHP